MHSVEDKEVRAGQDDAMVVEGVDATMRDMFLELRAMVEEMGGARGVLEPRALGAVQQLLGLVEVIIRTKGAVLPDLSHYAAHLDGSYALRQAVGLHGGGGSLGSADVEELETLPPPHRKEVEGEGVECPLCLVGRQSSTRRTSLSTGGVNRLTAAGTAVQATCPAAWVAEAVSFRRPGRNRGPQWWMRGMEGVRKGGRPLRSWRGRRRTPS